MPNTPEEQAKAQAFFRAVTIRDCYDKCVRLLNVGILNPRETGNPLFQAVVVQLLICLNDLVRKAASEGKRIVDVEHIDVVDGVADVTDLITKCRNAACHIGSPLQDIDTNRFRFTVMAGRGSGMLVNGRRFGCDFDDDIAIFYGAYRIYIRRHIHATLQKLERIYVTELSDDWMCRL